MHEIASAFLVETTRVSIFAQHIVLEVTAISLGWTAFSQLADGAHCSFAQQKCEVTDNLEKKPSNQTRFKSYEVHLTGHFKDTIIHFF